VDFRKAKEGKIHEGNTEKDAVGLALSGGGVRSASFNPGLLQSLHNYDYLKWIDYLSTVSGGGYIGSSLSWFLNRNNGDFPFDKCEDVKPFQTEHHTHLVGV
jgi:predicted acylesterase/phospholipase RssA